MIVIINYRLKSSNLIIRLEDVMSNQSTDGFQGSQPFITDNEYKSLSLDQLKCILNQKKQGLKDNYKELTEKEKIIRDIRKVDKLNEKVKKGIDIKEDFKKKSKPKKIKTFEEYFQECIKNKEIPKDTPSYFRKALERAIKEHEEGIIREKSALENFANMYVIEGEPGITPIGYFSKIYAKLKSFFTYHRNIKVKMILKCLMEQQILSKEGVIELNEDKAYFSSFLHTNLESVDVNELINKCINEIIEQIDIYLQNGSGWYFKEVVQLEIHTVEFNPTKGSSYIPLPDWITNKKAIVNIENKDEKCFLWCILRYLHPRNRDNNNNNNFINLLKKAFQLNLQCQISKT